MAHQTTQKFSVHKPPGAFTAFRWGFFCATVAMAIGQIALLDQRLTGIPWTYDGPLTQYAGRQVTIQYCLLSPNMDSSVASRCNYAMSAAVVSLGLSLIWSYIQVLRRNPFKHKRAKLADFGLCCLGAAWWAAAGVALCIFTDTANKAGMMQSDWRNGLCVLAWAQFLMFTGLAVTSALLISSRTQKLFDKWAAKAQQKKEQKEAAKLQKQRDEAALQEQQAAAARATAAQSTRPAAAATSAAGAAASPGPDRV